MIPVGSVLLALLVGGFILLGTGTNPIAAYSEMFREAFGTGLRALGDLGQGDAFDALRARRDADVQDALLEHRRRGPASHGRVRGHLDRPHGLGRLCLGDDPDDDGRSHDRRGHLGVHSRPPEDQAGRQRNHHDPVDELRGHSLGRLPSCTAPGRTPERSTFP